MATYTSVLQPPKVISSTLGRGQGVAGPPGPPGPAGDGVLSYTHVQSVASDEWIVNHNFGYRPSVRALTVGGVEMLVQVVHSSANQARVIFDSPTAGSAICS